MVVDFYFMSGSAPCRAVEMTAKAVGVELNYKPLNLMEKEQLNPEFVKLNPQHTIPTIVDDGFSVWESRAILIYLVEKYGGETTLYPSDPKQRAVVNQRLFFDMGTLYQRFAEYFYPQVMANAPADPEKLKKLEEALEFLNIFLENSTYAAGEHLTIADLSLIATISTFEVVAVDFSKFANVQRWFNKTKSTAPGYDLNEAGIAKFKELIDKLKNKQ